MRYQIVLGVGILCAALSSCNCGDSPSDNPPDGGGSSILWPDAGTDAGFAKIDGGSEGDIKVNCTGPRFTRVNTPATITCSVDSGGKAITSPTYAAQPPAGAVLNPGGTDLIYTFALNTHLAGYNHPIDFPDTTYRLMYEVKDATNASIFGRGFVDVTVLGNYWVGDSSSTGSGISVLNSDGKFQAQVVGLGGVRGVYDLRKLPDGNIIVSSHNDKVLKIFDRRGNEVPGAAFPDTDPNDSVKLWEGSTYPSPAPKQMALVGANELWVAGAAKGNVPGIAVFNWRNRAFLAFVPNPETSNTFGYTSIIGKSDGTIYASAEDHRSICRFRASDRQSTGPCVTVGETYCSGWSSFLEMSDGRLVGSQDGDRSSSGCVLAVINSSLATPVVKAMSYGLDMRGLVESGDEIVGANNSTFSVGYNWLLRANAATLDELPQIDLNGIWAVSGLVRLTNP